MSLMQDLVTTFEATNRDHSLWPVGHIETKADIEIVLDKDGNLLLAEKIPQEATLHPATEESAARTSGGAPHPLCDKIQYAAGDYADYITDNDKSKPYFDDFKSGAQTQQGYFSLLSEWEKFAKNPMLTAVKLYEEKRTLIADLIAAGIFRQDANGAISWTETKDPKDAFIRWRVQISGELNDKVWESEELIDSWRDFTMSRIEEKDLCYITGDEDAPCALLHPARLRYGGDKAKIISSNDASGYTYRGHFLTAEEACVIGYEATQKAHSALRWLIDRQSFRNDTQVIVAWALNNAPIPGVCASTQDMGEDDNWPPSIESYEASSGDVGQEYAQKLAKKINGYKQELKERDDIVVLALDSATTGRMALTYYRKINGSDFLERVEDYHTRYAWFQYFGKERKFIGAPSLKDIAMLACPGRPDAKLTKTTISRLIPVVVDRAQLPRDILMQILRKAVSPAGKERWEREALWGCACGLYRGSHIERRYKMSLEKDRHSRDYLYGRLLAVADRIEGHAIYVASGEKKQQDRDTSAIKLMQRFSVRPGETWMRIEQNLIPYMSRLRSRAPKSLTFYQALLDEIHDLFKPEDYNNNSPLRSEFLLGFHCQRRELWRTASDDIQEQLLENNAE